MIDAAALDAVRHRLATSRHRVKLVETAEGRVVVKRLRPARSPWRARAMNTVARGFGLGWLQAVPSPGGAASQAVEVARLKALAAAGVRVPEVLHVDPAFIVLQWLRGPDLVAEIARGGDAGFTAWRRGLAALADVHRHGAWLSQAFARNFIATDEGLAMIDFEEDPRDVMTLPEAQARDWLAYLHSSAWLLDVPADAARAALSGALDAESPAVRGLVEAAGRRLGVLRHLPASRRLFGREAASAQALGALFHSPAAAAPARA